METKAFTHSRRTPEEIRRWFNRAKARQQQLEEEGRRMWEKEQAEEVLAYFDEETAMFNELKP